MGLWQVSPEDPTLSALTVNIIYLSLGLYGYSVLLGTKEDQRTQIAV